MPSTAITGSCSIWLNTRGIGVEVSIKVTTSSGRVLFNQFTTSVGFMSSSDPRAHFELRVETQIKRIEVRWPSSILQQISSPTIDSILRVEEPVPPQSYRRCRNENHLVNERKTILDQTLCSTAPGSAGNCHVHAAFRVKLACAAHRPKGNSDYCPAHCSSFWRLLSNLSLGLRRLL